MQLFSSLNNVICAYVHVCDERARNEPTLANDVEVRVG